MGHTTQESGHAAVGGRRRAWGITAVVLVVAAVAGAFALRTPSPVGHWNSRAGY